MERHDGAEGRSGRRDKARGGDVDTTDPDERSRYLQMSKTRSAMRQ